MVFGAGEVGARTIVAVEVLGGPVAGEGNAGTGPEQATTIVITNTEIMSLDKTFRVIPPYFRITKARAKKVKITTSDKIT